MPQIRPAEPIDAGAIAEILDDVGVTQVVAEPDALTRQRLADAIRNAETGAHDVFVAEGEDAGVIGFVAVNWTHNFRQGIDGLISDLFVHNERRGHGAGSALLDRVKLEARRRGCSRLVLYSGRGGDAYERGFYPKQGFREHDELACFMLPIPPEAS